MAGSFLDRLTLDQQAGAWFDQTRRYMLIRPEALMGIFRPLPAANRAEALSALENSIFEQGTDSAQAYRAMGGTGEALLDVIAAAAPQLGWGIWSFGPATGVVRLSVRNSPFAVGFGPSEIPVCAAITGMLRAVAGLVLDRPAVAREVHCASMGADICRFEAWPVETST